jgi:hypothetical protein
MIQPGNNNNCAPRSLRVKEIKFLSLFLSLLLYIACPLLDV